MTGAGLLASGDAADDADCLFLATPERSATGDNRSPTKEEASVAVAASVAASVAVPVPVAVS